MRFFIPAALFVALVVTLIGLGIFTTNMWIVYVSMGIVELAFAVLYTRNGGHWIGSGSLALVGIAHLAQGAYWSTANAEKINSAIPLDNVAVAALILVTLALIVVLPIQDRGPGRG